MPSEKAIQVAAQLWCDKRVSDRVMDVELATVIAEKIDEYIDALKWCVSTAMPQADFEKRISQLIQAL